MWLLAALSPAVLPAQDKTLAVPSNLLAAQTSPTEITLVWQGVSGATEYVIYGPRAQADLAGRGVRLGAVGGNGSRYVTQVVAAGVEHRYSIQAVGAKKVASQKVEFNPIVPAGPGGPATVSPPSTVTAELGDHGTVNVHWDAVPQATAYMIGRSVRPNGFGTLCSLCAGDRTTYRDTATVAGSVHIYSVTTITARGRSSAMRSNEVTPLERGGRTVVDTMRPPPPRDFTAALQLPRSVELTWSPVEGATSYRLSRSVGNEPARTIATVPSDAPGSYVDQLQPSVDPAKTAVEYRIVAFSGKLRSEEAATRISGKSAADSAKGGKGGSGPTGLKAGIAGPATVRLTWLPGVATSMYQIKRNVGNAGQVVIGTVAGTVSSFLDKIPPGLRGAVSYVIEAADGKGRSEEVTVTVNPEKAGSDSADQSPKGPGGVKASVVSPTGVRVTWLPGLVNSTYNLMRSVGQTAPVVIASLPGSMTSFLDHFPPGAMPGVIVYFLEAADGKGRSEKFTLVTDAGKAVTDSLPGKGATADTSPEPPADLKAAITGPGTVTLTWTPVSGATYQIQRSILGPLGKTIHATVVALGRWVDQLPPMPWAKSSSIVYSVVTIMSGSTGAPAGSKRASKPATLTVTIDPRKAAVDTSAGKGAADSASSEEGEVDSLPRVRARTP
jgi:hypothetical protein